MTKVEGFTSKYLLQKMKLLLILNVAKIPVAEVNPRKRVFPNLKESNLQVAL